MTWLIYGIIAFAIICVLTALAIVLAGSSDDRMVNDWWRDQ